MISNRRGVAKIGLRETAASNDLPFMKDMIIYSNNISNREVGQELRFYSYLFQVAEFFQNLYFVRFCLSYPPLTLSYFPATGMALRNNKRDEATRALIQSLGGMR